MTASCWGAYGLTVATSHPSVPLRHCVSYPATQNTMWPGGRRPCMHAGHNQIPRSAGQRGVGQEGNIYSIPSPSSRSPVNCGSRQAIYFAS